MLIHTVFFWLKPEADKAVFASALDALAKIDLIKETRIGTPGATEARPVVDQSWTYVIHLAFNSVADHDAYQVHPDHDVFIADCKEMWEKVVIYDAEV